MADIFLTLLLIADATLRVSTPLILCAMAGLFSERAGIIDISLEGKMLIAAFFSAAIAYITSNPWLGLMGGIASALILSLIHSFACITHRGNQVVSGIALNILVSGLTVVLGIAWFARGGQTPQLAEDARFLPLTLVGADWLDTIPILGQFYRELLSGHNILVYLTLLSVPLTSWIVYRTRFGLRLRAVGENPEAVDAAGISVTGMRYSAVLIGGIFTGIAGTYLAIAQNAAFVSDMSAGQGYIALAAMIFGKWRPGLAFGACLIFGLLDTIAIRMQGFIIPGIGQMPVQLIQALPYILTVILLAGFIGKAVAPRALGQPYGHKH